MNRPLKMYPIKPVIQHDEPMQLPDCMYAMKNLLPRSNNTIHFSGDHVSSNDLDVSEQKLKVPTKMSELLQRQEKILKDLADLKMQMLGLRSDLNVKDLPVATKVESSNNARKSEEVTKVIDHVINASPANPPYSLLLIQKLWKDFVKIKVTSYVHSTIPNLPDKVQEFVKELEKCSDSNSVPEIHLKLIWKDVDEKMELIASPSASVAICGEVNILRYFSRVGPENLNYETYENPTEIDSLLDICYLLSRAKTKTEKQSHLSYISGKLGRSSWLFGRNSMSIADIAASSVIKQVCGSEVNTTLSKWLSRFNV